MGTAVCDLAGLPSAARRLAHCALLPPPSALSPCGRAIAENDVLEFHARTMWMCLCLWTGSTHTVTWRNGRTAHAHSPSWVGCPPSSWVSICTPHSKFAPCDIVMDHGWAARFHEFTFRWSEAALDYFLDGVHINHMEIGKLKGRSNPWANPQALPS